MKTNRKYHVISSKSVQLGRFLIRLDTVEENGNKYPYSYVEQKNSVGILGFDGDKIILIRQYRHAIKSYEYEIPGGGVEQNETAMQVAYREMLEETGYSIDSLEELGVYYPSPGSSNELCYLFLARCRKDNLPTTEPLEYIDTELVDCCKFEEMIRSGVFKHSMGLVAWLKYKIK